MLLRKCKRGEGVSENVIKWIIALAIIVVAGFAAKNIIFKAG